MFIFPLSQSCSCLFDVSVYLTCSWVASCNPSFGDLSECKHIRKWKNVIIYPSVKHIIKHDALGILNQFYFLLVLLTFSFLFVLCFFLSCKHFAFCPSMLQCWHNIFHVPCHAFCAFEHSLVNNFIVLCRNLSGKSQPLDLYYYLIANCS